MRVFFDSSALAKRYLQEAGSESVLAWCERATEIGLSGIALPEIVSAFCRLALRLAPRTVGLPAHVDFSGQAGLIAQPQRGEHAPAHVADQPEWRFDDFSSYEPTNMPTASASDV